jgi:arginine/lysine/ornithine decarboxylase
VSRTGLSGHEVERVLAQAKVYPELATSRHLLFLFTPGTRAEDTNYLLAAVERATEAVAVPLGAAPGSPSKPTVAPGPPPLPAMALTPREAYYAPKRTIDLAAAAGAICGETIAPYPPGSAAIVAGETLDAATIAYLRGLQTAGAVMYGASDRSLRTVRVVDR